MRCYNNSYTLKSIRNLTDYCSAHIKPLSVNTTVYDSSMICKYPIETVEKKL